MYLERAMQQVPCTYVGHSLNTYIHLWLLYYKFTTTACFQTDEIRNNTHCPHAPYLEQFPIPFTYRPLQNLCNTTLKSELYCSPFMEVTPSTCSLACLGNRLELNILLLFPIILFLNSHKISLLFSKLFSSNLE